MVGGRFRGPGGGGRQPGQVEAGSPLPELTRGRRGCTREGRGGRGRSSGESRILDQGMPPKNFHIQFGKSILVIQ